MRPRFSLLLLLPLAAACGGTTVPHDKLSLKQPDSGPPDYRFDDSYQNVLHFNQGYLNSYDLISEVHVPAPGVAHLTIDDLPQGASFDGATLSWTPACGDNDFYTGYVGEADVLLTLKSNLDDQQYVQRRLTLLVHQFVEYPDRKCGDSEWKP